MSYDVQRPRRAELDGRTAARLFELFRRKVDRVRIIETLRVPPHVVDAAYAEFKKGSLDQAYKQSKRREKTLAEIEREEKRDRDFDRSLRDAQRASDLTQTKIRALKFDDNDPIAPRRALNLDLDGVGDLDDETDFDKVDGSNSFGDPFDGMRRRARY